MQRATALIAALFVTILLPGLAYAACDGPTPAASITVRIDHPPVGNDHSIGLTALSAVPSESKRAGMEEYEDTLGLTASEIGDPELHIDFVTKDVGNGVYCTQMRSATLAITWTTTVYIAAEIKPGSCMEKTTSEHEQGHVRIEERLMPIAKQALELALAAVGRHGVAGDSAAASQAALEEQANATVKDALTIFSVVRKRKQLDHDSKEEYDRLSDACGILEYLRLLRDAHKKLGT